MKKLIIGIFALASSFNLLSQDLIATQSINGTVNGKKISANYHTSLNPISGEALTKVSGNWDDDDLPTCFFDITICNITIGKLEGQNGAENLSNYLTNPNYERVLTYTYNTGEKITFSSKINLNDLTSEVEVEGNYPKSMQDDFLKFKKIELSKPATFKFINGQNSISYSGDLIYNIGDNEYTVNVATTYKYIGKTLPVENMLFLSKGVTTVSEDGKSLSKVSVFTLTK